MNQLDHKFTVDIMLRDKRPRISKEIKKTLAEAGMTDEKGTLKIKGISAKMLKRMRQEYVTCPVMEKEVQFIQCFVCGNFQSRVTGQVLCKGDPL